MVAAILAREATRQSYYCTISSWALNPIPALIKEGGQSSFMVIELAAIGWRVVALANCTLTNFVEFDKMAVCICTAIIRYLLSAPISRNDCRVS